MMTRFSLALMLLAGTGCLSEMTGGPTPEPTPTGTRLATIEVVDAVIAPGKTNRTVWDAIGTVPTDVWTGLATALGASEPFAAVVGFLDTQPLLPKPDPFGTAALLSTYSDEDGIESPLATKETFIQDTFTPTWPTRSHWENVALTSDLRVRVTLTDKDLTEDDVIGAVELNARDIESAITAGQVVHVKVSTQGTAQILFVGLWAQETGVAQ